jgi:hypothetical protein
MIYVTNSPDAGKTAVRCLITAALPRYYARMAKRKPKQRKRKNPSTKRASIGAFKKYAADPFNQENRAIEDDSAAEFKLRNIESPIGALLSNVDRLISVVSASNKKLSRDIANFKVRPRRSS